MGAATQIPRPLVLQSTYSSIDAILKDLKLSSRRIQQALAIHADELQLLQRIYYKNKNQHRGALFWGRVSEMRRFSERLSNADILSTLEQVRNSFFAPDANQNPKRPKGSWTHVPIKRSVAGTVKRFRRCEVLLQKMQGRLVEAYRSFKLTMQSGAFAQLLLVLAAIASRLHSLSIETREAISAVCLSLHRFLLLDLTPSDSIHTNVPSASSLVTENDEDRDVDLTEEATTNQSVAVVQQPVARVNVQRRSELHNRGFGKVQAQKTRKVKKTQDEIDDIFAVMA